MKHRRPGISTSPSRFRALTVATASLFAAAGLVAQTHKVVTTERVTRAVAVYEWTGDLDKPKAARLVPVSLFINSRLEDASVYLARPVPFSLQTGDLYEIEKAGHEEGIFALDHARHVMPFADTSGESSGAWFAYGKFSPVKPPPKAAPLQASAHLPTITSSADSDRPKFANRTSDPGPSPKPTSGSDKSSSTSDSGGPTLKRPTADKSSSDTDTKSSKDSKDDDIDRPTLRKRDPADDAQRQKQIKAGQSGVTGPEVSLNDDPDRPHMRHGAPAGAESTAELTGLPADMHQVAAVSDAANRDAHIFARDWESPTERADTLARLEAIARPQVAAYVSMNKLTLGTPIVPTPATATANTSSAPASSASKPAPADDESGPTLKRGVPREYQNQAAGKPAAKPAAPATQETHTARTAAARKSAKSAKPAPAPPLALENEQLTPYTLSYGGLPTFVYSAQASLTTGGPVYVTVVAQRMVSGDFQVALSSVTDAAHLDRTPWLRLVDAVDPDAGHRASLLFELRAQTTRQFALYRLTSSHAEQIFSTGAM